MPLRRRIFFYFREEAAGKAAGEACFKSASRCAAEVLADARVLGPKVAL
jgi:hypothetical protein